MEIKFSIITVCYNSQNCIIETTNTLLGQNYLNWEYIIKDGASLDDTLKLVTDKFSEDDRVSIYSSEDGGIFSAMNEAVEKCTGDYIYFLNAGDYFDTSDILCKIADFISDNDFPDVVYGDLIELHSDGKAKAIVRTNPKFRESWLSYSLGYCICHQSMFIKRTLWKEKQLDLRYRVIADKEWQMYELSRGAVFLHVNFPIARVSVEGFSNTHVSDLEKETVDCLKEYYPFGSLIFRFTLFLKKSKTLHRFIRFLDAKANLR